MIVDRLVSGTGNQYLGMPADLGSVKYPLRDYSSYSEVQYRIVNVHPSIR